MANSLLITKLPDDVWSFVVNGDFANEILNIRNDLLTVGDKCHFKTSNGANLIQKQDILPTEITLEASSTFTFANKTELFDTLIAEGFFDWIFSTGSGGVDRFDELSDTFSYAGNEGMTVRVNETLQKLEPVEYRLVENFTDLDDTPDLLIADKMVVVNPAGTALILVDQPEPEPQLLNSVGSFRYQDLATQSASITVTGGADFLIPNDSEGLRTDLSNNPFGVPTVYFPDDTEFGFTSLSVGDCLGLRVDISVRNSLTNQPFKIKAVIAQGSAEEEEIFFASEFMEDVGTKDFSFNIPFSILNSDIKDNPLQLFFFSEDDADISNVNYYVEVLRKNINIVSIENTIVNNLQEVTDQGSETTNAIRVGVSSEFIKVDRDKLQVKVPANTLAHDTFLPNPGVDGDDVFLVSTEMLATSTFTFDIFDGIIGVTVGFSVGQTTFTLPSGAKCLNIFVNGVKYHKTTANNTARVDRWSQSGNNITIYKTTVLNNYFYCEYQPA